MSRCVYPIYYNGENYSSATVANFNFNISKINLVDIKDSITGNIVKGIDMIYGTFDKQIPANSIITLYIYGAYVQGIQQ